MNRSTKVSRRAFLRGGVVSGPLVTCSTFAQSPPKSEEATNTSPDNRLVPWMMAAHLEHYMSDYRRIFDAWSEGGVRGLVIGRLSFAHGSGNIPTFPPDPTIYKAFGVDPPPESPRDPEKEKQLQALMDDATSRGWEVLIFGPAHLGGARPVKEDPFGVVGLAASLQDYLNAFPQAHGLVFDSPGQHTYELSPVMKADMFGTRWVAADSRGRDVTSILVELGVDMARFERGMNHLLNRFHNLTPSLVRYHSPAGVLNGLELFDINEDALYWLRTLQETTIRYLDALRGQIDKLNRKAKVGAILRTPAFSMLTTQNFNRMHPYFDYIFTKHYFWHRGYDGMYGTIARWVERIQEWNPGLTEADCFAVVKAWFGITLPRVHALRDLDMGFPDEFFDQVVFQETRRALEAVGNDDKVLAWVSTARSPHGGDPMSSYDLNRILIASQRAGLKRFVYQPDPYIGVPEWETISGLCGKRWKERPGGYWPEGTPRFE